MENLTISDIKDGICSSKFSVKELTQNYLNKIKKIDSKIKSYITITEERALNKASEIDQKIKNNKELFNLTGVPCSVKDVLCVEGERTTAGSNILKDYKATFSATSVSKIEKEDAVILGKVNCDAFAHGASTENSDFFTTHNPWDLDRTPGGSSGGSAASVAADLAVFSLGTDTGGSVRSPANYCGVVGLKPSYGRVSRFGLLSMTSSNDCVGVLAKNVLDSALVLQSISGKDEKDATSRTYEVPDYASELLKMKNLKGLKIGIPKEFFSVGINPEVKKAISQALLKLQELGAEAVEISLPHSQYSVAVYYIITPSEVSSNLAKYDGIKYGYSVINDLANSKEVSDLLSIYTKTRKYGLGREAKRRIMIGTFALSSTSYKSLYEKATALRFLIAEDFKEAFKKVDIIASPVSPNLPFKIGEKVSDPLSMYLEDIYLSAVSLVGLPAISVPCGFSSINAQYKQELPIGLQLIGKYFDEASILKTAYLYEQSSDSYKRFPNLAF